MRTASARALVVATLLGLTALMAAVLAVQAATAAREHRMIAERVLHDYAALGAEGVAQRLKSSLNSRFNGALGAAAAVSDPYPTVASLRAKATGSALEVVTDSTRVYRVHQGDSLAARQRALTTALPAYAYFGLAWQAGEHGTELLVFQPLREPVAEAMAITMPRADVAVLLGRLLAKESVLPASLTHGAVVQAGVGLRITGAGGVIADRHHDSTTAFRARVTLEPPYADLAVEVSLAESLAPTLVIGGLPPSRVPMLVALFALTLLLTFAAGDQLRRELQLSRLRDDFVSSVSHELRTPLAQIRMFAETLRLGRIRSSEEGERSLRIVENEARRLEHLVENLLHFSRSPRRAMPVHRTSINLAHLLEDIAAEFRLLAAREESTITVDLTPDTQVSADSAMIRQMLLNLLDNAVKYGPRGQTIGVRVVVEPENVRIEVSDEGPGISPADRERIWKRFWRSESARAAGVTGTGVGLAIVRDLVELHGGRAFAEVARGGGARIVLELPRAE